MSSGLTWGQFHKTVYDVNYHTKFAALCLFIEFTNFVRRDSFVKLSPGHREHTFKGSNSDNVHHVKRFSSKKDNAYQMSSLNV